MKLISKYTINKTESTEVFWLEDISVFYKNIAEKYSNSVVLVDEECYNVYKKDFSTFENFIQIKNAELSKSFSEIEKLIYQINDFNLDKNSIIIGIGGGATSDIVGFLGSIFMRGISVGFIPTTLLSMVDASIGGKNGVNIANIKNAVGTIHQPDFIGLYPKFVQSLPRIEMANGCAEIIKYGAIFDKKLWDLLYENNLNQFIENQELQQKIIEICIKIKIGIISEDTFDKGIRRTLNFGHTFGHAIESLYRLSHGKAVAAGMMFSAFLSQKITRFSSKEYEMLREMLIKYELPSVIKFEKDEVLERMMRDKKREKNEIQFILLSKIGKAKIEKIGKNEMEVYLNEYNKFINI